MENDNQIIIQLLREQNTTLHQLLEFHQKKEKREFRNIVIHYFILAIPYIIIIILGYYLYEGLKSYLDAINNNIKSVQDGYLSIQTSMQSAIDKLSSIPSEIINSLKNLNPFQ
jgi:hypothetical protein